MRSSARILHLSGVHNFLAEVPRQLAGCAQVHFASTQKLGEFVFHRSHAKQPRHAIELKVHQQVHIAVRACGALGLRTKQGQPANTVGFAKLLNGALVEIQNGMHAVLWGGLGDIVPCLAGISTSPCPARAACQRPAARAQPVRAPAGLASTGEGPPKVAPLVSAAFNASVIPSVAYTDPEVAWVGLTEDQAMAQGIKVKKGLFPWTASGRAIANGRDEGVTKLLFDDSPEAHGHGKILGGGMVGTHAGDMIGEIALAIEMGADAVDIGKTIHPHPTLGESIGMAAEVAHGSCTDLPPARK